MSASNTTEGSLVEALFVRRLKPTGVFADELRRVGVDVANLKPKYEPATWVASLVVARRHAYPARTDADAYRQLGRELLLGFLDTIVGRVLATAMPFLNPRTFLQRTPRFMRMGRPDIDISVEEKGPTDFLLLVIDPAHTPAAMFLGVLEVCLERLGVVAQLAVEDETPPRSRLRIRWS